MAKINFQNKDANSTDPATGYVRDADLNEIKSVVNENADELAAAQTAVAAAQSTADTAVANAGAAQLDADNAAAAAAAAQSTADLAIINAANAQDAADAAQTTADAAQETASNASAAVSGVQFIADAALSTAETALSNAATAQAAADAAQSTADTAVGNASEAETNAISTVRGGVVSAGDTLAKLYTLIQSLTGSAPPEAYDPSGGAFPATFGGAAIKGGNSFRITADGTMGATNPKTVAPEDLLIALVNNPANDGNDWTVVEGNRGVGTSAVLGLTKLYSDLLASNTDGAVTQAALVTAIGLLATKASPALTGTPTAPTAPDATNNTQIATTQFVHNLVDVKAPLAGYKTFKIGVFEDIAPVAVIAAKRTFRMSYAMQLTGLRAELKTAQTSGTKVTVDVKQNGVSILSTPLTIDNGSKTSVGASVPVVISTSALLDDAEITIGVTAIGDGTATGLKVTFIGQ
jgi:hypothetical protein